MMALPDSVFGEADAGNTAWILMSASLVLLMTPALAFFYGGLSRGKSVLNMMMMSFGTMGVIGIVYVLWGFSMSFGNGIKGDSDIWGVFSNPFGLFGSNQLMETKEVGEATHVVLSGSIPAIVFLAFQLTFAVISVALISGALAERVSFVTWLAFAVVWATLVYFPLAHMVWGGGLLSASPDGLAAKIFGLNEAGDGAAVAPIDFAGGTVVHINAGMAALVLVLIIGARRGFGKTAYRPHNIPFVMLGAALLWFGWFGFNAGSALAADASAGKVWVNTTVATAAAMMGWLAVEWIRDRHATSVGAASGVVAGLVAVTPACGNLTPVGSIILGIVAGVLAALAISLKSKLGYDDSLDVVGVHLVAGLWGTIALGFLAWAPDGESPGLFYGGDYKQLVIQLVIAGVAVAYCGILTALIAFVLKPLGWRISDEEEATGIDETEHAETAYDYA
ncbi:MAG TPA: ammonium transporter [Gordonia sp. (in: high G+C Gram-positive bacteria)]|uniref:ammonium transporter n=1 Tax=unclassified Gordonia (in: high G+C Gram-positive bacteria) TaxID=2657482 RepID=UPI000F8FDF4E|nr:MULTISPECIES: ammonium transporter [unclassified Gordonia (in: high G+C Gram-positive bacteria)]RUP36057.1 MAG: ammonium transporter [Gordonia sp. (in: high G+C Gram-positive bacteria)]HNP58187.1 ammonium transporter [Gordonia sp. (in: high G+C Gram-positive bacteria)]HRC51774.1 ammonium transporter [Gordonia sp. (in: high G+C Gram-positive bacteria)]